jgi:hypothetical protein
VACLRRPGRRWCLGCCGCAARACGQSWPGLPLRASSACHCCTSACARSCDGLALVPTSHHRPAGPGAQGAARPSVSSGREAIPAREPRREQSGGQEDWDRALITCSRPAWDVRRRPRPAAGIFASWPGYHRRLTTSTAQEGVTRLPPGGYRSQAPASEKADCP